MGATITEFSTSADTAAAAPALQYLVSTSSMRSFTLSFTGRNLHTSIILE